MTTLGTIIVSFFRNHLTNEAGVSPNTLASYSDCIRLLLEYACETLQVTIDTIALDTISDAMILDFLDYLENQRGNETSTRNQRLTAIKTFFRFIARQEPTLVAVCERVCAIRSKKTEDKLFETLETDQVQVLLDTPDTDTLNGARNAVLLGMLYSTGARVQELVDLDLSDVQLGDLNQVIVTGKGRKQRIVPIWEETARAIDHYLELRHQAGINKDALLLNARGKRITRFGINYIIDRTVRQAERHCPSLQDKHVTAHTFRHTVALHMIQSDVDIVTVRDMLGHADIKTTSKYVEINLEMKRAAIEACPVRPGKTGRPTQQQPAKWRIPKLMVFLKGLSRATPVC